MAENGEEGAREGGREEGGGVSKKERERGSRELLQPVCVNSPKDYLDTTGEGVVQGPRFPVGKR